MTATAAKRRTRSWGRPWVTPEEWAAATTQVDEEESSGVKRPYGDMRSRADKIEDAVMKERIIKGIDLLEKTHGPGWADAIDLGTLDLSSTSMCVLGQVYSGHVADSYSYGANKLGISGSQYGFDTWDDEDVTMEKLQHAWELVLDA